MVSIPTFRWFSMHFSFVLSLIAVLVLADYDSNISNGTCYYSGGKKAPDRFIPCGNAAGGHKACCESQDMCLSSNACYSGRYGVTYLAGCTDPNYQDSSCPDKGGFSGYMPSLANQICLLTGTDQSWAGLVYCNGTSDEWTVCEEHAEVVTVPSLCWCPATSRTVAFHDASRLDNIMALPITLGGNVTWQGGNRPVAAQTFTDPISQASTTTSMSSNRDTSVSVTLITSLNSTLTTLPSSTSLNTDEPLVSSQTSNLGTRAKTGIGVGAGVAAIVILAAILATARYRKGKKVAPPIEDLIRQRSPNDRYEDKSDVIDSRSPTWLAHKSELSANETAVAPVPTYTTYTCGRDNKTSEFEENPTGYLGRRLRNGGHELPEEDAVYEMPG